ncbi:hypothetical protein K450DRAFT_228814 [Umbelopsis ramanniana AG]|uniref:Cryptic loci regulator 2 N-terminal domain-containing protein n=1 Tax=Umbelopsis ramanniana AG TaxID=1314678 RepID=A0AAD5EFM5_UMBRA|nr:uncharacterized protein K450DRAFT_228814 [Umbelopsis ramanniana AG]KAI8582056.1 hypothetical protein K450DRAFT_228814 [Umbelopsis ramanniana AG]
MSEDIQHITPPKASDANSEFYPVKRAPNGVGQYVEISTETEKCDYWMYLLGTALAEKRKINHQGKCRLQALPPRYKMFDHQRHNKSDIYIYGHPSKERFRSALQFRRHLLWLDQKSTKPPCGCKLCALLPEASEKKVIDVPEMRREKMSGPEKRQKVELRMAQRLQQKVRKAEKKNKLLSPTPWTTSQTRRSATSMSSPGSNEGTMERTPSQEHVVIEMHTPHKLGLSNPIPLKSRNKKADSHQGG